MNRFFLLITYFLSFALLAQAQNSERQYTDHKPEYRKWQNSYILDKIEYRPDATIFFFRFICDNAVSGGAIFYPPGARDAWYLKGVDVERNFPLVAVKNIRRDGILINKEVKNEVYNSLPLSLSGYTIFSCEVHFGALDNEVKVADLIEGVGQEYNRRHFNCLKIKLKTWDDETLGSEDDSRETIASFEKKTGKSTLPPVEKKPIAPVEPPVVAPTPSRESVKEYTPGKKYLRDSDDLVCNEILILSGIHFQDNSTEYRGIIEARKTMYLLLRYLKEHPKATLTLYGHTDIFGSEEENMDLSKARVFKVQRWLSMYGINPKRIDCQWYGPQKPLEAAGSPKNRRVEARLNC